MTTPHNHVLIDDENVQPEVASRLAPGFFKVWVFVGALQNKVKFDGVDLVGQWQEATGVGENPTGAPLS